MKDAEVVERLVRRHFGPSSVVRRRVNPSNPTNLSFAIDAGADRLWLKVAADPSSNAGLDLWAATSLLLAEKYCAPVILDRISIGRRVALLFARLDLPPANPAYLRQHGATLLGLLDRLHHDGDLGSALATNRPVTAGEVFRRAWVRRFTEDLAIICDRVPFAGERLLQWMRAETVALELATRAPSFDVVVEAPIHGDLWAENILVDACRHWILDWDDLAIGDPVVDDAVLLYNMHGCNLDRWSAERPPRDPAEGTRFAVAARAQLLDQVIDTLADWVELPASTPVIDRLRHEKEISHRTALADYRERYGGGGTATTSRTAETE